MSSRKTLHLLVGLVAILGAMPLAAASHMQNYANVETEHDDQGRSDEPNFAGTTSIFGAAVGDKVVDTNGDGVPEVYTADLTNPNNVLAPGCTDDNGREPSGTCGLVTIDGLPGTTGMSGDAAPGRFTPTKSTEITFLSNVITEHLAAPSQRMFDYNHKVRDLPGPVKNALPGQDFLAGIVGEWLWWGDWHDQNGNGVIDHQTLCGNDCVDADNEFVWRGNCVDFFGIFNPDAITNGYCRQDTQTNGGTFIYDYAYPGNHHGNCGGNLIIGGDLLLVGCFYMPMDMPGVQVYCTAKLLVDGDLPPTVVFVKDLTYTAHFCPNQLENVDGYSQSEFGSSDFLFDQNDRCGVDAQGNPRTCTGPGGSYLGIDFSFNDRSGDPSRTTRHWAQNVGWGQYYYDTSLLATTIKIVGMYDHAGDFNLANAKFTDVDKYVTWSPGTQALLMNTIEPTTASTWRIVRDFAQPVNNFVQQFTRSQTTDPNPTAGPVDDAVADPGLSHEPNTAADVYPGATFGGAAGNHEGFLSSYAAYGNAQHGFMDFQAQRIVTDNIAFTWNQDLEELLMDTIGDNLENEVGVCVQCTSGPGFTTTISAGPRDAGDHSRSLDPGEWDFLGFVGLWQDKPQSITERILAPQVGDPLHVDVNTYGTPKDTWVGSIVDTTGDYQYRGYGTAVCTIGGVSQSWPFAFCHPYNDGQIQDPNNYFSGALDGEWRGQCQVPNTFVTLRLDVQGGQWTFPTIVYRNLEQMELANTDEIEILTDTTGPIFLRLACFDPTLGFAVSGDMLFLPLGNLGKSVTTTVTATIQLPNNAGTETVRDVDSYTAFGSNL
jgi:hypothetical protein